MEVFAMRRHLLLLASVLLVGSCSTAPPAKEPSYDANMLGRWDGTVQGEDPYPLWFELSSANAATDGTGTIKGRLQPRTGHALEVDDVEATGTHVTMHVAETTYEAEFDGAGFQGTGTSNAGAPLKWAATRAPELPEKAEPKWGPPTALFDGKDLAGWKPRQSTEPNQWTADGGVLLNRDAGSDLVSESTYDDLQLHIEVNVPEGSNSGIYLRGRYEVQVQDDFGKQPTNTSMGAIYGQVTPIENAALAPGEWQSFDITLVGRFVTVALNDKTIINHQEIPGITGGALDSDEAAPGPFFLQGDHGKISYRNIMVRRSGVE
jgi:3-keto-disaccharide hydrolase